MSTLTLPYPPSTNALYRAVKGRSILSEKYRAWKREAGLEVMAQRPTKHDCPVSILVDVCAPDKRRRDIDNVGTKAVLDLLKTHNIIPDDDSRYVRQITARWVDSGPACLVTIQPVQEA